MSAPPVVLITGCSKGGMGFALAEEFGKRGCTVYASARRLEAMNGFQHDEIRKVVLDITNSEQVNDVVQGIVDREGKIDILVSNAGRQCPGPLLDVSIEETLATFNANAFAALRLAKAVMPHMAKRKSGLIMNVGSVAGDIPTAFTGIYCASKAALHSITEVLRLECGVLGIDVILVVPGAVRSNIASNALARYTMPPDSLYRKYFDKIVARINLSQGKNALPTHEFAEKVASVALGRKHPQYVYLGGFMAFFKFLKMLPRTWALALLWKSVNG